MRRWLLTVCLCLLPAALVAQGLAESVVSQLRAQGYSRFTVESTFLGRLRILATGGDRWREIVVNPHTGEIVRDYSRRLDDATVGAPRIFRTDDDDEDDDVDDRSGRRGGDDDDEDRSGRGDGSDDDDDDDDDDDRSGRRDGNDDEDRSGRRGGDDDDDD